jgi:hypothetical protein
VTSIYTKSWLCQCSINNAQKEVEMVKHIVMWKLRDKADAGEIKGRLEALAGKIPGLLNIEVGH